MKIEQENLFKAALEQGINLFLGSGFSVLSKDNEGKPLPLGKKLGEELVAHFSMPKAKSLDLPKISTILNKSDKHNFYSYLVARFTVKEYDPRYSALDNLNIKTIFTTNIDDLIINIFSKSKTKYLNDLDVRGPSFFDRESIDLIHLHGCVQRPDKPMFFGSQELAAAFHSDPDKWHFLTQRIQSTPTFFWGYQLEDSGTLEALNPKLIHGRPHKPKWLLVLPDQDEGDVEYFKALDFNVIVGDTSEILDYFINTEKKVFPVNAGQQYESTNLFPSETIPEIGKVPVKPIIDFYMGSPPSWGDIYSGNIHRTKYYYSIYDSILSGKHTAVIGVPACGKTTLMMQVASDISFDGFKLVMSSPSSEKAALLAKRLNGKRALLFIDNFTDSIDSFYDLSQLTNVTLIGFDREYNFAIVSHRLNLEDFNVMDVSDIYKEDIQSILDLFPPKLRRAHPRNMERKLGINPTIFDVIEAHIIEHSLRDRYRDAIVQLRNANELLAELLICLCYVYKCRTPISFDMLLAFLREDIDTYEDVYHLCSRLGSLIADYAGVLANENQDYYIPRSTIIAEAVIDQAPHDLLTRVISKFHNQVSPARICRFDIFRRTAYDAELMKKVFQEWEEGIRFYERMYERDQSPYLLQQGALYLAARNRYDEAFSWIDKAIVISRGQIFSIRNSHAILLFKANIHRTSSDPTVRQTLRQSMDILTDCYNRGSQKTYHAIVFGEQAIQYWNIYGDEQAKQYLETANQWLADQQAANEWNRRINKLNRNIASILVKI